MSVIEIFECKKERFNYVYKKISPKKLINLISANIAQRFGIFISEIQPIDIQLETTRGCNFKCVMCDAWKFKRISFLHLEEAKRILNQFNSSIFLTPYGIGEPFLNKHIYDIVRYASFKLKFIVGITSNFSVISPQKALNMGANEIMASIDSIDPEKFLRLRGISLDIVIKNLKTILSLKPKNKEFPIIAIRTIISNENIEELQDIVEFGLSMGVKKFYFQDSADGYLLRKLSKLSKEEISKVFLVRDKFKDKAKIYIYLWDSKAEGFTPTGYCFNAFFIGTIGYDGELYTCCRYFGYKEASLGNVLKDPQKALKNRLIFLKRFRSNPPDFCKNCETYCRMCSKNGKA